MIDYFLSIYWLVSKDFSIRQLEPHMSDLVAGPDGISGGFNVACRESAQPKLVCREIDHKALLSLTEF